MLEDLTHPVTGLRGLTVQAATLPHKNSFGAHHVHG